MRIIKVANSLVVWDVDGLGNVPNHHEINYMGFIKEIAISDFRKLVPSGVNDERTKPFLMDQYEKLQAGVPDEEFKQIEYVKFIENGKMHLAPPFIHATWIESDKVWRVDGHEGRSRTDFVAQLGLASMVPLYVLTRIKTIDGGDFRLKGRDITDEQKNAGFIPQDTNGPIVYL